MKREYSFGDLDVHVNGKRIDGLRGFMASVEQEKEVVYARRNQPYAIQRGQKSYTGEITVLQSEFHRLDEVARALGGSDITDLRTVLIVATLKPDGVIDLGEEQKVRVFCEFTKWEFASNQNDKFSEITLPFIATGIEWL